MSLISQLFSDETFDPFLSMINRCPVLSTPTDWKETKDAHVFISDIPGLKKEEVKVDIDEGRLLQISGERNAGEEEDDEKNKSTWHRVERCRGKFQRRFRLPENAKVDEVTASMENGVLVATVPKKEVKKAETRLFRLRGIRFWKGGFVINLSNGKIKVSVAKFV